MIDTLQTKLRDITKDGTLSFRLLVELWALARTVLSGTFAGLTVIVLTLYFLVSLPKMTELGLHLVPASRRDRVSRLTNAVIDRVGAFVGSQITVSILASVYVLILSIVLGTSITYCVGNDRFSLLDSFP
ncbi:MAG: hypothetical protein WDO06_02125 [Actinomycetota bacterium]